ncbi:hypothetical protein CPC08DRAFT_778598 [Agrocybe pediades]|nr:hypothetical protein CPC08DRAFT_778598 [Agrocybe pediades]
MKLPSRRTIIENINAPTSSSGSFLSKDKKQISNTGRTLAIMMSVATSPVTDVDMNAKHTSTSDLPPPSYESVTKQTAKEPVSKSDLKPLSHDEDSASSGSDHPASNHANRPASQSRPGASARNARASSSTSRHDRTFQSAPENVYYYYPRFPVPEMGNMGPLGPDFDRDIDRTVRRAAEELVRLHAKYWAQASTRNYASYGSNNVVNSIISNVGNNNSVHVVTVNGGRPHWRRRQ